jgi:hypothetical protein
MPVHRSALFLPLAALALLTIACGTGQPAHTPPPKETPSMNDSPAAASCYRSTELSSPKQMRIDCANGHSFVVRQGEDGKWREEVKVRAGILPDFASLDEAARSRCGC